MHNLSKGLFIALSMPPQKNDREAIARTARFILFLMGLLQVYQVLRGGAMGQDFEAHKRWMLDANSDPFRWLVSGQELRTSPPLYHLIAAAMYRIFGDRNWLIATGLLNVLLNVGALFYLHKLSALFIRSGWVQLTVLMGMGFLPAFQTTAVVFAADSPCQLPVMITGYNLALYTLGLRGLLPAIVISILAIVFVISIKFTAFSLVPAIIFALLLASRTVNSPAERKKIFLSMVLFTAITLPVQALWVFQNPKNIDQHFSGKDGAGNPAPENMNLRSLLFFRAGDAEFLGAPSVWDLYKAPQSKRSLFQSNYYSYPGLVWLSLFTDVMNIFQPKTDQSIGKRTWLAKTISPVSVMLGLPVYIVAAGLSIFGIVRCSWFSFRYRDRDSTALISVAALGLSWLLTMGLILLASTNTYTWQYWLPRLIMPSLMIFAIVAGQSFDFLISTKGLAWERLIFSFVLLQSTVQTLSTVGW